MRSPRRVAHLALLFALAALLFALPAHAAAPPQLDGQLTDQAGAVADKSRVQRELDRLRDRDQIQLFVTYVDSFDGMPAQQWADTTAQRNGLGVNDMLLAVAVRDRQYAWSVSQDFPLNDTQLRELATKDIEPRLQRGDWTGAAVAAARGVGARVGGPIGGGGFGLWGGLLALLPCVGVLLLVGAIVWALARSTKRRVPAGVPGPTAQPVTPAVPTGELEQRAGALLVEMDDALETSEQDVGFAEAEFGAEAAAPFRQAVERARADVGEAFRLQQRLTDSTPDTEEERRRVLTEIVQRCERADDELESHAARFEQLRARAKRGPEIAVSVEESIEGSERRVEAVEQTLASLRATYPASALAAVEHAPEQARERLGFASRSVADARAALGANDRSKAAGILSAAEEAAAQAARLLDSVEAAEKGLASAEARLQTGLADMRQDIAAAEALPAGTREAMLVAAPLASARVVLAEVGGALSAGHYDPLALLRRLEGAAVPLDAALAQQAQSAAQAVRAGQGLDEVIATTRGRISAIREFIATNRGGVGTGARAALAEAQARLAQAEALRDRDPCARCSTPSPPRSTPSRRCGSRATRSRRIPGRGDDIGGMILGGILLGQLFGGHGGGFGGGRRGGFGNFSPGSFGGSASRRGGGGRF